MRSAFLCVAVLALAGAACPGMAMAFSADPVWESPQGDTPEDQLYEQGTRALDDGDWDRAAAAFTKVAKNNGARADAAVYWLAYALNKQGRKADALALLAGFSTKFPKSSWDKDVRALELEIRQSGGARVRPESENDEDLKLMAINSLLNSDPERAVPLLENSEASGSSPAKERALFVLAHDFAAHEILAQVARGNSDPDLQERRPLSRDLAAPTASFAEIYASPSSSAEVKEKIPPWSGERGKILAAAKGEQNARLRSAAVHQLGVMGARSELWQLYQSEGSPEVKRSILQAMFIAGDSEHILELLRTETSPELRREMIRKLGIMGTEKTGVALVAIYRSEKDLSLRRAALDGLFVQNNAQPGRDARREGPGVEARGREEALRDAQPGSDRLSARAVEGLKGLKIEGLKD